MPPIDVLAGGVDVLATLAKLGTEVHSVPPGVDLAIEVDLESFEVTLIGPGATLGLGPAPNEADLSRAAGAAWDSRWRFRWSKERVDPSPSRPPPSPEPSPVAAAFVPAGLEEHPIEPDELSVRAANELRNAGIDTVGAYLALGAERRAALLSEKTLRELHEWLEELGVRWKA